MEKNILSQVFGETIVTGKRHYKRELDFKTRDFKSRLYIFQGLLIICFLIIFFQLVKLTLLQGNYYQELSKSNRIRENVFPAPRGIIADRKGEILVRNKPGYVAKVPCGERECYRKITHDEALKLEAKGEVFPLALGVSREYTDSDAFSHILGFTGNVNENEIGKMHCGRKLTYEDQLGRSGVEEAFDCSLQGNFGKELIETDALGNKVKVLSKVDPTPGKNLTLSIDKRLQLKAKELLKDKVGTVIAHIPQTGEILILYSSPSFDLSKFSEGLSQNEYNNLLNDPNKPLFNRAISGVYPPGSIFKPIIAAGALEEKVITKDSQIEDTGVITIGTFSFANWYFTQYGKKEGFVNVTTALKRSNDIYFYKVGEGLGVNKIASWARKFKLGESLGIEIGNEEKGLVPDTDWKEKVMKEQWFLGDTYHYAIGQGNLLVTPLQIAYAIGSFGNNGVICKPTILKRDSCEKITDKLVSSKNLNIVKEGMIAACSEGGTGYPFFGYKVNDKEITVACKTGTAEFGDPKNKTHAWFSAFAPANNPQIAITVLVEGGGEGSSVAAPIAKEIFNEWFSH